MTHTMIDHVSLGTKRFDEAIAFYTACLSTLGYRLEHRADNEAAFGIDGKWDFWLYPVPKEDSIVAAKSHVAIAANSPSDVTSFFDEATRRGAGVVRQPGERPDIGPDYFGTVLRDLDGHTVEVVHWAK